MKTTAAFERIINNPEKMERYKENKLKEGFLQAMYKFVKDGHSLADLPWYAASLPKTVKKAT